MRHHHRLLHLLAGLTLLTVLVALSLLLAAPAGAQGPPVTFPPDPERPVYAQREISLEPEPPMLGIPTEVCAWVVNTSAVPVTVTLEFGAAPFGIGLPFTTIGQRTIVVPPNGKTRACIGWVPRQPGHWCIQVLLHQDQYPVQWSQRNIDVWEALAAGRAGAHQLPRPRPGHIAARDAGRPEAGRPAAGLGRVRAARPHGDVSRTGGPGYPGSHASCRGAAGQPRAHRGCRGELPATRPGRRS